MKKAEQTGLLIETCANDALRAGLPVMFTDLEKCQRSLEGYLEQKRDTFPRFYFASDAILLQILSQGSDPTSMNQFYDKVFDGFDHVAHRDQQSKFHVWNESGTHLSAQKLASLEPVQFFTR